MKATILCLYNDGAKERTSLIGDHGQSLLIDVDGERVLFDTGAKGAVLLNNMDALGIDAESIDRIILSHGHYDHTWGLPDLLSRRSSPVEVIAHPVAVEPKVRALGGLRYQRIGFPRIPEELQERMVLRLSAAPVQVTEHLSTTGEISENDEKRNIVSRIQRRIGGEWTTDDLVDDLSLVLRTSEGSVLICGCCHAGILNTLAQVRKLHQSDVHAVLGGIHMLSSSVEDVDRVIEVLESEYGSPILWLNHCTGENTISSLREHFSMERVRSLLVGEGMEFPL